MPKFLKTYEIKLVITEPLEVPLDRRMSDIKKLMDGDYAPAGFITVEVIGRSTVITVERNIGEDLEATNRFADDGFNPDSVALQLAGEISYVLDTTEVENPTAQSMVEELNEGRFKVTGLPRQYPLCKIEATLLGPDKQGFAGKDWDLLRTTLEGVVRGREAFASKETQPVLVGLRVTVDDQQVHYYDSGDLL
jgi:hypothetical protein